ncbi:hypothetical protein BKA70DRAFT_1326569 [Coprinopsis sp. MPI-PUGE-AT-0042]|nr:hypothetical protein BKA70DRAFT_1326569 [Coprinopsis sp. MPI-PUGE-AT-0042]
MPGKLWTLSKEEQALRVTRRVSSVECIRRWSITHRGRASGLYSERCHPPRTPHNPLRHLSSFPYRLRRARALPCKVLVQNPHRLIPLAINPPAQHSSRIKLVVPIHWCKDRTSSRARRRILRCLLCRSFQPSLGRPDANTANGKEGGDKAGETTTGHSKTSTSFQVTTSSSASSFPNQLSLPPHPLPPLEVLCHRSQHRRRQCNPSGWSG